jgi:hypothetical protein
MRNSSDKNILANIIVALIFFLLVWNLVVLKIYYPFRIDALLDKCEDSFQKKDYKIAEQCALKLLSACKNYEKVNFWPWEYWNYGNAIHNGNTILGLVALYDDDLEAAKRYFIQSGQTPGSPQLDTYGPNMLLAKELIERGHKDIVLEYFQLCSKFWDDDNRLFFYSKDVKKNVIPNFDKRSLKF